MFAHLQVHMQMENHYSSAHKGTTYKEEHIYGMLIDRKMMKKELCELADVSPSTISKMGRGEIVSMEVIARICLKLNCTVDDILEILPDSLDYGTDEKIK